MVNQALSCPRTFRIDYDFHPNHPNPEAFLQRVVKLVSSDGFQYTDASDADYLIEISINELVAVIYLNANQPDARRGMNVETWGYKPGYQLGKEGEIVKDYRLTREEITKIFRESTISKESLRMMEDGIIEKLREKSPMSEFVSKWQETPGSCQFRVEPNTDCISLPRPEGIKITIRDFRDVYGNPLSKFHHRIAIEPSVGSISGESIYQNGNTWYFWKSFQKGGMPFTYIPPESTNADKVTIKVYNSCELRNRFTVPLTQTPKHSVIGSLDIEFGCGWKGTISREWSMGDIGGEISPPEWIEKNRTVKGKSYLVGGKSWTVKVRFKKARESKRMEIHELQSAILSTFRDYTDYQIGGTDVIGSHEVGIIGTGEAELKSSAVESQRRLKADECQLRLLIDKQNKTYQLEGELRVEGITERTQSNLQQKVVLRNDEVLEGTEFEEIAERLNFDLLFDIRGRDIIIDLDDSDSYEQQVTLREKINVKDSFGGKKPNSFKGEVDDIEGIFGGKIKQFTRYHLRRPRGPQ